MPAVHIETAEREISENATRMVVCMWMPGVSSRLFSRAESPFWFKNGPKYTPTLLFAYGAGGSALIWKNAFEKGDRRKGGTERGVSLTLKFPIITVKTCHVTQASEYVSSVPDSPPISPPVRRQIVP